MHAVSREAVLGSTTEWAGSRTAPGAPAAESRWDQPERAHTSLADAFHTVRRTRPDLVRESEYTFAGARIRLTVLGPRLADVYETALAHVRVPASDGPADFRVQVWHERECGLGASGLRPLADPRAKGRLDASATGRWLSLRRSHTLTSVDRSTGDLFGWIHDLDRLGIYERGRPFNSELLLFGKSWGLQALHAGLVAHRGRGALITGPSGSGKSTATLSCLLSGLDFLSDDYVALDQPQPGRYRGHSLFASAFVVSEHLRTFPALAAQAVPARYADEEKSMVPLSLDPSRTLARNASVAAILLPRVVGCEAPRVRPASPTEALLRMAPSTMLMLRKAGVEEGRGRQQELDSLSRLVESVPAFWLELGGGVERIPARIRDVLEDDS